MRSLIRATLTALLLLAGLAAPGPAEQPATGDLEPFTIRLGAAELAPAAGSWTPPVEADAPFLVQFYDLPEADEAERWRARGVELLRYVGGNAYVVRAPGEGARALAATPSVRAALELVPEMKRSRLFESEPALAARARRGELLELHLKFFPHVSFERARTLLSSLGITTEQERYFYGQTLGVRATWRQLVRLLESHDVAWVDPQLPPVVPTNRDAGERVRVDRVLERGFRGADGSGVRVGIWDWFTGGSHVDWRDRVVRAAVRPGDEGLHGLAVSGIVAGAGTLDPRARGMAPGATLYWYSMHEDLWSRIAADRAAYDVRITNHSWGFAPGWIDRGTHWRWNGDLWVFGYYHAWTAAADDLARTHDVLLVTGTGNSREESYLGPHKHDAAFLPLSAAEDDVFHEDLHPTHRAYAMIQGPAVGKNVLTVGVTTKDDAMNDGSGWGPTGDGRVKPDLVAPGVELRTTGENDAYGHASGVSFAIPVVSGSAALLVDYYSRSVGGGALPSALLLKSLLIHGTRDLGRRGPDYSYGHGMADVQLAARVLRAASQGDPRLVSLLAERRLAHGQKRRTLFEVPPGARELRATLVWHDPPGERLVNDLDLWLVTPSRLVVRPFVLDPERPTVPAVTGVNRVDNVESVRLRRPEPGSWRLFVRATRVPMGAQSYVLVVSAGDGNIAPLRLTEGACDIARFFATSDDRESPAPRAKDVFRYGDPFYLVTRLDVPDNADYGEYHGSIHVTWTIADQDGTVIVKEAKSTTWFHTLTPEWRGFFTVRYQIPRQLPAAPYVARTVVRMRNGERATAEYSFRVEDE